MQQEENLENVDSLLCFTVFSARSPFARQTKIEATGCAAQLQKCTENAQATSTKFKKIFKNLTKIEDTMTLAKKTGPETDF